MSNESGYSTISILAHWFTAILVVALFVTHEAGRGSLGYTIHVSFGALAGVFLLWRIGKRLMNGTTTKPEQNFLLNLLSDVIRWALLFCIAGLVITGYLLPWSLGQPIDMAGLFHIDSPLSNNPAMHKFWEQSHDFLGHIIVPLVLLHIIGAFKHLVTGNDRVFQRMIKPVKGGK